MISGSKRFLLPKKDLLRPQEQSRRVEPSQWKCNERRCASFGKTYNRLDNYNRHIKKVHARFADDFTIPRSSTIVSHAREPVCIALPPIMRSQVARHVLRRLSAHQGMRVVPPSCVLPRPAFRTYPVGCRIARSPQRRTFLAFFKKPPRTLKELEAEPGYETFLQFCANENDYVRPPPRSELIKAWREFFAYKAKHARTVNSTQALCAHRVLRHLSQPNGPGSLQLSEDDLRLARDCLVTAPRDDAADHLILAKALYTEIRRKALNIPKTTPLRHTSREICVKHTERSGQVKDFYQLLATMAHYGQALEARDLLVDYYKEWRVATQIPLRSSKAWMPVIHGLAREGHERDLLELVSLATEAGLEFDSALHGVMSNFYARRNRIEETKSWFSREICDDQPPSRTTYYEILQFAIRNDQRDWAKEVYRDLVGKLESGVWRRHKTCWDTSFGWAAALLGKGVEHVEHMLRVALEKTQDSPGAQPNITSINSLLKVAVDNNDPYLAERLMSLAEKIGFEPNLQTYLLQMEYRLNANDLDGAFTTFRSMPSDESSQCPPVLNEFIRALCSAPTPNYERILEVTSYLEQRRSTLEPQTVVSICMAFLRNDEHYEVIDTLSLHTAHYSINERQTVRKAFVDYCLDPHNSTARVWDSYALLRQFFPELENEYRVAIIDNFFDRKRADMACHVFGHMRGHGNPIHRPTLEVYTRFFEGIGRCPDLESLKTVHNMLKMDTTITPNTLLCNGLMIAYTACDLAYRALDFWREITASVEGPSYQSLEIVFRACEVTPSGDAPARELWEKMQRMEIDVPVHVYSAYAGARAAHGHLDEAKALLEDMENVVGQRPNLHTLAIVFNALQSQEQKDDFEAWALEEYTPVWEKLQKKYKRRDTEGVMKFRITRAWKA
ncbi:hypothetical protein DL766_009093 [Monosporascus sp. MC13-8B]|nr:hypothetical protein DL766_009093 [Monosporascus sp. MC13-8B]